MTLLFIPYIEVSADSVKHHKGKAAYDTAVYILH